MPLIKRLSFLIIALSLVAACTDDKAAEQQSAAAPAGVPVDVAPVVAQRITEWDSFTGRLEAPQQVSLRPRVSGYIDFVAFEEGEYVEQGDTLFLIDNRQFKAEVQRLEAQLQSARSQLRLARQDKSRAEGLRESQSISKEVLDTRISGVEQAQAQVAQTQAALELARLNRGFARVEAPIAGRVSRANITQGNYVTAGQTVLTSIVSSEKLYAYFDIDETTWLNYQQAQQRSDAVAAQPVAMRLANEDDYRHWGRINFVDNQVNSSTGTLRVRAVFANENKDLMPGLFAHLKLAGGKAENGILVAEKAIGTDLNNKYVMVVNQDNKVEYRAVKMGDKVGGSLRIIKSGLKADDIIVVNGLQRIRPGATVAPNTVSMADEQTLEQLQAWQQRVDNASGIARRRSNVTVGGVQ
ncbi:efflux RND transporter periplasmic adaptor subunit [Salinimonas marina]|uniref:Efflux RND transporter periplasmic adaptor subunit n=1 Tax=Salinimonas marina TaxID=2785918 RepID=A0A7S9DZM9_9ALTE|nr:efflux RND transporter periplasmic adaptor subunit [Salinimonas marina]QPG06310.1 efflux RND transporter periplasmic adaptor subunit [Salinimonas marina]